MGEDGLKRRQPKRDAAGKKIEKVTYIPAERLRLEEGQHARGINMADEIIKLLSVRPSERPTAPSSCPPSPTWRRWSATRSACSSRTVRRRRGSATTSSSTPPY